MVGVLVGCPSCLALLLKICLTRVDFDTEYSTTAKKLSIDFIINCDETSNIGRFIHPLVGVDKGSHGNSNCLVFSLNIVVS